MAYSSQHSHTTVVVRYVQIGSVELWRKKIPAGGGLWPTAGSDLVPPSLQFLHDLAYHKLREPMVVSPEPQSQLAMSSFFANSRYINCSDLDVVDALVLALAGKDLEWVGAVSRRTHGVKGLLESISRDDLSVKLTLEFIII